MRELLDAAAWLPSLRALDGRASSDAEIRRGNVLFSY